MPHLLWFSRDTQSRLERLARSTGKSKKELIEGCLAMGMSELESRLLLEESVNPPPRVDIPIDQLLRESGLGA